MATRLDRALNIEDLRQLARHRLPKSIFEFVDGGAQDEVTLHSNRHDFGRHVFLPRVLTDISKRQLATTILGSPAAVPLVLAPTGLAGLLAREGELLASRAAARTGLPYCLSTMATCSIEQVAAASDVSRWFQLYVFKDRGITGALIDRAKAAGCTALVLTVDTKFQGPREHDMRNGFTVPPRLTARTFVDFVRHFGWLCDVGLGPKLTFRNFVGTAAGARGVVSISQFVAGQYDLTVNYRDLEWFKAHWGGPVAVKGILTGEDAARAVDHGADGIIVSNHGGRQLDGAISAIRALPRVVDAVGDRAEVILDGGVRRGADVVKALCLGARACMIGRAWLYGLAAGGEAGVRRALDILIHEMDIALGLLGRASLAELDRACLDSA
ncbi:MAG: alpha-hydroxy acid oxidase [Burkholderiales bacterium]